MIDVHAKASEQASGIQRMKIKWGFHSLPNYACHSLSDFLAHKDELKPMDTVYIPFLTHAVLNHHAGLISLELSDTTNSIDAYASETCLNSQTGNNLYADLGRTRGDARLYRVTLRNGMVWPPSFFSEKPERDDKLYLMSFSSKSFPSLRTNTQIVSEFLESLFPENSYAPVPIRIHS